MKVRVLSETGHFDHSTNLSPSRWFNRGCPPTKEQNINDFNV